MARSGKKYELGKRLAVGGMAEVFLAQTAGPFGFRKTLVVKRILPQLAENPDFITMFLNEARLAALLNHANIVQVFELWSEGGNHCLAMELVDGPNLSQLIKSAVSQGTRLPATVALKIVSLACEGLAYAHEYIDPHGLPLRVVHRDVSPHNILVGRNGNVKVADFGIAKAASLPSVTRTGQVRGKVKYAAPEQLEDEPLDCRTDVWAMGVTLYEALTGASPFDALTEAGSVAKITRQSPAPLQDHGVDASETLQPIIDRALAKSRLERYPDARALQKDLDGALLRRGEVIGGVEIAETVARFWPAEGSNEPVPLRQVTAPTLVDRRETAVRVTRSPLTLRLAADGRWIDQGQWIDPVRVISRNAFELTNLMFEGLVRTTRTNGTAAGLAEWYEADDSGLHYRFRLKAGVRFHDGRPLTTELVRESFLRLIHGDPATTTTWLLEDIAGARLTREPLPGALGVRLESDRDLEVTLSDGAAPFLLFLAGVPTFIGIPNDDGRIMGTGPYRLAGEEADRFVLERFAEYHGAPPTFDRIEVLKGIRNDLEAAARVASGGADATMLLAGQVDDAIDLHPGVTSAAIDALTTHFLVLPVNHPALRDRRVRLAIRASLDTAAFQAQLQAKQRIARAIVPPALSPKYRSFPELKCDVELARSLLRQAGVDRLELECILEEYASSASDALFAKCRAAGIQVTTRRVSGAELCSTLASGNGTIGIAGWAADYPSPEAFLRFLFHSSAQRQCNFGYSNPDVDRLLDRARRATEPGLQNELFHEAEELILADCPVVPLTHGKAALVASTALRNIKLMPGLPTLRISEWTVEE